MQRFFRTSTALDMRTASDFPNKGSSDGNSHSRSSYCAQRVDRNSNCLVNTDYMIQIKTKPGRTWSYRKEKNGWSQAASTGIVRQLSGDQLLSNLLPPLAGDQTSLSVTVERKKQKQLSADFADSRRLKK
jgi:hypothetical protein